MHLSKTDVHVSSHTLIQMSYSNCWPRPLVHVQVFLLQNIIGTESPFATRPENFLKRPQTSILTRSPMNQNIPENFVALPNGDASQLRVSVVCRNSNCSGGPTSRQCTPITFRMQRENLPVCLDLNVAQTGELHKLLGPKLILRPLRFTKSSAALKAVSIQQISTMTFLPQAVHICFPL